MNNRKNPSKLELENLFKLFQNQRLDEAEKMALSISYKFPKHPFSYKILGALYNKKEMNNEALKFIKKSLTHNPEDPDAYINLALTFEKLNRLDEAEESYKKALSIKGDDYSFHFKLANFFYRNRKLEQSKIYYNNTIELSPNNAAANNNLGITLFELGELEEAKQAYYRAISIKDDYSLAYNNLSLVLHSLGELFDAERFSRKAIELNSKFFQAYYNLARILKDMKKYDDAEEICKIALKLNYDYSEAHNLMGILLKERGKLKDALASVKEALRINPDQTEAKINLNNYKSMLIPSWHISMMNDGIRNKAFSDGIKLAISKDDLVLELGTGSGLLSMMAVSAGAKEVVTCEESEIIAKSAKEIIEKNGFSKKIKVINKNSKDLLIGSDISRKPDVIISEILSAEFVGEGVFSSIFDANNRLLKTNGKMLPESGDIMVALIGESDEVLREVFVDKIYGYDLSGFNSLVTKKYSLHLNNPPKLLSDAKAFFNFDLYIKKKNIANENVFNFKAKGNDKCIGIIQWMKVKIYKDIEYENKPGEISSHWPTPIYLFDKPINLKKGQEVKIKGSIFEDSVWFSLDE